MGVKKSAVCLAVSLMVSSVFALPAFASSPSPPHPDRPNLAYDTTIRKTAVVHMVNATPYNLVFKSGPFVDHVTQQAAQDYDEGAIIYSPSGVPHQIPAKTGGSFVVSWLDTGSNASTVYPEADIVYTLQNVNSSDLYGAGGCITNALTGNVDLHFEFDRVKQTKELAGEIFKTILHTTATLVDLTEFVLEGNPVAFVGFVTAAAETAEDIESMVNSANSSSDQIYVNAYIVAASNNLSYVPSIVSLYTSTDTAAQYDGIATLQSAANGCPQSDIVVQVALLREKSPSSGGHLNGQLPTVLVTLATYQDWMAASVLTTTSVSAQESAAANKIALQLKREGRNGQKILFKLVRSLKHHDLDIVKGAYHNIAAKKPLTKEQELKLAELAAAFEKHQTAMPSSSDHRTIDKKTVTNKK